MHTTQQDYIRKKFPIFDGSSHTMRTRQPNNYFGVDKDRWDSWTDEAKDFFNITVGANVNNYKVKMLHCGCDTSTPKMQNAITLLVKTLAADAADFFTKNKTNDSRPMQE